ncbi:MAG: TonB-dependent receptor [Gammaproteobacteria bacterium]
MNTRLNRLSRLGILTLIAVKSAFAQSGSSADKAETLALEDILVIGKRSSLATAQEIKRDKMEIVDSVVADSMNKLPDINVTDALSRVTGVQILRDRGEGAGVAIRGLTQMETLLNGREVFTAGSGRTLDFADIPSEMLAGLDVYKTSSANHIEGGIGGTIDLRTRRPFDFEGRQLLGTVRGIHGDLVDKQEPQFSTLLSDRWQTEGFGEFGALANFAYQRRAWREDQKSTGNPAARTNIIPGQTVFVPSGTSETSSLGHRERIGGSLVLQWRPTDALELYAEGNYAEFKTIQNSYQINVTPSSTFASGSPRLFPGTHDLQSIRWTNAPISILSFARDTVDRTQQGAVGGSWSKDALTLKADLSYTKSFNNLFFSGPVMSGTAATFNQDLSGKVPSTGIGGTDLLNPANFQYASLAYRTRPFRGELSAAQLDGDYDFSGGFIKSISAGFRYAKRNADNAPGLIFADAAITGISATDRPGYVTTNPVDNFLSGEATSIGNFLTANLDSARDAAGWRKAFGISAPIPSAGNPLGVWGISEETQAGYLMGKFEAADFPLDGNIGLRVVRTLESVTGSKSAPSGGAVLPINVESNDFDYLPSLNLRYKFSQDLYVRVGASQTITRQNFDQLSPSLTLIRNTITPSLNQGGAGNPELKPIRSDNFDLAVEKYFNSSTSVHITGFLKQVDGFVSTVSNPEVHDGFTYQVSRPQNSAVATINGFEVGYQQFYDFLPSWLSGFGMQANYTYVDSETPSKILGRKVPLQNLSKHSYNLIGMYEKGPFSARVAYNWRDTFLSSTANIVGVGALPVYTKSYGWLDASVGYRINDHFTLTIEGMNLLNTLRTSYYGVETRPQSAWGNDTQVGATLAVRF